MATVKKIILKNVKKIRNFIGYKLIQAAGLLKKKRYGRY